MLIVFSIVSTVEVRFLSVLIDARRDEEQAIVFVHQNTVQHTTIILTDGSVRRILVVQIEPSEARLVPLTSPIFTHSRITYIDIYVTCNASASEITDADKLGDISL